MAKKNKDNSAKKLHKISVKYCNKVHEVINCDAYELNDNFLVIYDTRKVTFEGRSTRVHTVGRIIPLTNVSSITDTYNPRDLP